MVVAMQRSILLMIFFFLFSLQRVCSAQEAAVESLLWWKSTSLYPTDALISWTANSTTPCNWKGITCDDRSGEVVEIELTDLNLNGTLDGLDFSVFPELTRLNLRNNSLYGAIPANISLLSKLARLDLGYNSLELSNGSRFQAMPSLVHLDLSNNALAGPFPEFILGCTNLTLLDLSYNLDESIGLVGLSGNIPDELGEKLPYLQYFSLGTNAFTGGIPTSFSNLRKMEVFDISSNKISGEIPHEVLSNMTQLILFSMDQNALSGVIPSEIGILTNLTYLSLHDNRLTGAIPPEIGNLVNLMRLLLHTNNLNGGIPTTIENLVNLKHLDVHTNLLEGVIPSTIGNLVSLKYLDLSSNRLWGVIPSTISKLENLQTLSLSKNNFTGILPIDLGSNMLRYVYLNENEFSGEIPRNICRGGALIEFTASFNSFSGDIPECFRTCFNLIRVLLDSNHLTGEISKAFGNHPYLRTLHIGNNRFTGGISSKWGQYTNLTFLQMSNNNLTGEIPSSLGNLSQLLTLNLASNSLEGNIPPELANLSDIIILIEKSGLQYLDLSSNNLSGEIPITFSNMMTLEVLNVSRNHLSGGIPTNFSGMKSLQTVDFSYNNLSGPVPSGEAFRTNNNSYVGNPNLCGETGSTIDGLASCSSNENNKKVLIIVAIVVPVGFLIAVILVIVFTVLQRKYPKQVAGRDMERPTLTRISQAMIWEKEGKFTFTDIVNATDNFNDAFCIGKGGFGSVYKAEIPTYKTLAVKRLHVTAVDDDVIPEASRKGFENEIRALTEIRHRNIVKLHGFCSNDGCMYLVYEYLEMGSLGKVMYGEEVDVLRGLDWGRRAKIVRGLAHALAYLHHDCYPPIVHRDVSINNVLLDSDFEPRLSDFGTARLLASGNSKWTSVAGSYGYMAPELASITRVTTKCDVYSFGVIAFEVMMGKHPGDLLTILSNSSHSASTDDLLLKDLLDKRLPSPTGRLAEEVILIIQMVMACIKNNPGSRPTMRMVAQELSASSFHGNLKQPFSSITLKTLNKGLQNFESKRKIQISLHSKTKRGK